MACLVGEAMSEQKNRNGNKRGMNPNSRKNLEKGREGNNHAKKDYSVTRIVKEWLDKPAEERFIDVQDKEKGLSWRQAIALRMLRDAVGGKYGELLDRLEGKVTQPIEAQVKGDVVWKIGKGYVNNND